MHRDIKLSNFLVDYDDHFWEGEVKIKLIDFGLAVKYDAKNPPRDLTGTIAMMAPELINGDKQTLKVDSYALGIILYELLCGEKPFDA